MREGLPSSLGWGADGIAEHALSRASNAFSSDDLDATLAIAREAGVDFVAVDSYGADERYLDAVAAARPLLVLDDLADRRLDMADLVVNPTPNAEQMSYRLREPACLLAGPEHALLHPAFAAARASSLARRIDAGRPATSLIVMGGADTAHVSETAVDAVLRAGIASVRVVLGPAAQTTLDTADRRVMVLGPQSADRMADHMAWADLAIATPSTLGWELATVGCPAILVPVVTNQHANARALEARGLARICWTREALAGTVDEETEKSAAERAASLDRWSALTDGCGADRVVERMEAILAERSSPSPQPPGKP